MIGIEICIVTWSDNDCITQTNQSINEGEGDVSLPSTVLICHMIPLSTILWYYLRSTRF